MKRSIFSLLAIVPFLTLTNQADAQGRGRGPGGGGGGGGPIPQEARETIHSLFTNHESIVRTVTVTEKGYQATTTSEDPKIVAMLQEHVSFMEKRLDSGFPVRRWDPAFAEFFEHYDQLDTKIRKIDKGLSVDVTGKTPEAVKVAQNHAKIISGFVEKGDLQHHAEHPTALEAKAGEAQPGGPGKGCEKCKEACQCEKQPAKAGKAKGGCGHCKGACQGKQANPPAPAAEQQD